VVVRVISIVSLVEVVGITLVVPTHPLVTTLLVEAAPANAAPVIAAEAAAAEVVEAVAVNVGERVPVPEPVRTTVVATSVGSTFMNPTPLTKSDAPKLIAVAVVGATDAKAPDETVAFEIFAPLGVIVKASSPTSVVAFPAASLNVKRYSAPYEPDGVVDPPIFVKVAVVGAPAVVRLNVVEVSPAAYDFFGLNQ